MIRMSQGLSVLAASVLLAGCGSDDDEPTTAASTASTAVTSASTAATAASTATTTPTATTGADPATGAGGEPASGDPDEYAGTYERECAKLVSTLATYTKTFSGDKPPAASKQRIVTLYKAETSELLFAMRSMFRTLAKAEPPAEYAEFQRSIVAVLPQVELKVDRANRVVERIRTAEQAPRAGSDVKRALSAVSTDDFPASLQRRAPSCQRFG